MDSFVKKIARKEIFYFNSDKFSSNEPHYFICIETVPPLIILVCCTTQWKKRMDWIESNGHPNETLVWVKNSSQNGLKTDSYVDCNNIIDHTIDEFIELFGNQEIEHRGTCEDMHYLNLLLGLSKSYLITGEIKDFIAPIISEFE